MQVTISGDIGSGKSTVGQYLATMLGAELIDCGQLYRKYAAKKDMSVLQLNQSGDNSIDIQIDNDLVRWGREDLPRVYISRTAWHFIPNAVHMYMLVDPILSASRICNRKTVAEKHDSLKSVLEYNKTRIAEEDARYERMYGITRKQQLADAGVLLHIGNGDVDEVCYAAFEVLGKGKVLCFDPRTAIPTQVLFDTNPNLVNCYAHEIKGHTVPCNVKMQLVDGIPYIVDGHHRIAAACHSGVKFMYTSNFEIVDKPVCRLRDSDYYDWEDYVKGDMHAAINR